MTTLDDFTVNVFSTPDPMTYTVVVKHVEDEKSTTLTMLSPDQRFSKEQVFASLASKAISYVEMGGLDTLLPYGLGSAMKAGYDFLIDYFSLEEIEGILASPRVMEQRIFGHLV